MRKTTCALLGILLVAAVALPGFAGTRARPTRFGALDRGLTDAANQHDGVSWAAWAYRNGAEYDVAVSFDRGDGIWSEPTLIGQDDGRNQMEPSLTFDARGTLYLVFTDRTSNQIMLTVLPRSATSFATPIALTPIGQAAGNPAARVVGDRLVIGYRLGRTGVALVDVPLVDPGGSITTDGSFTDGPDPVGGTGEEGDEDDDEEENGNTTSPYPMGQGPAPPRSR